MPQARQQRRRNPNVIAHVLTRSIATGRRVRAILRESKAAVNGVVVRKEIDPERVEKDPKRHPQASCLIFTFADGTELAVNSIEAAVDLPPGH